MMRVEFRPLPIWPHESTPADRRRSCVRSRSGLEALRAVDRHGITRRGEQYAGFKALPPGGPSVERGRLLVEQHGSVRRALLATHPDHGGDPSELADVQAYREAHDA